MALNWIVPIAGFVLNRRLQASAVAEMSDAVHAMDEKTSAHNAAIAELKARLESLASAHADAMRSMRKGFVLMSVIAFVALILAIAGLFV